MILAMTRSANPRWSVLGLLLIAMLFSRGSFAQTQPAGASAVADATTLEGKVVCGYQGWFTCPGDGSGRDWTHYAQGRRFEPGRCVIDFWPDMTEFDADERFATSFRHADGSIACVFSPANEKTVRRHFRWMRDYGIDGAMVQRFAVAVLDARRRSHVDRVLRNCREAANASGRVYNVMYDLSGLSPGKIDRVIEDWKHLVDDLGITREPNDRSYLRHRGKPLVSVWGLGFKDRLVPPAEWLRLVEFLQAESRYGRCAVMLGVPTGWRTLSRDCLEDPAILEVIARADLISPWTPGRYRSLGEVDRHAEQWWAPDLTWCRERNKAYLPVVFPGFSWHNLKSDAPLDQIPRLGGEFFWRQCVEARKAGATMLYVAMFDEMNEGTCIFKCTNDPPVGQSAFLTYEGLPTDHYLWLAGEAGRLLRKPPSTTDALPKR